MCSVCSKEGAKRCSKCKLQYYCSKECQQSDWKNHKAICRKGNSEETSAAMSLEPCSVCSKEASKKCSNCKLQFYCSKQCQKEDWKNHKAICKEVSKAAEFKEASEPATGISPVIPGTMKDMVSHFLSTTSRLHTTKVIPEYHKEYEKAYPKEKANIDKLRDCWIMARTNDESLFGDFAIDRGRDYGMRDFMKRWNYAGPALETFLSRNPKPGDIFTTRIPDPYGTITNFCEGYLHDTIIYQTMRNTPVPPAKFQFGNTYVSVGFVDLFPMLVGSFHPDQDGSQTEPLIFVGYDKSDVVIARAIVIYEMLLKKISLESILQVWFSTGLDEKTQKEFQKVCCNLMKDKDLATDIRVKKLLNHWAISQVGFKTVLPLWKQFVGEYQLEPLNNLRYEKDRLDYARYMLTGKIFGKNDKDYVFGNVTIFSLPEEFDNYHRQDQNFFAALSFEDFTYEGSLIESVTTKLTKGLATLMDHITNKRVICKFLLRNVDLDDRETLEEIQKLNAKVIDWSNIPDYMPINDFFAMTKICNGSKTRHSMHFMNWQGCVFGTSLLDYPDKSSVFKKLKKEMMLKYDKVKKNRSFLRQDHYLVYYMNAADQMLSAKYRKNFIDYITTGRDMVVSEPTSEEFNPFERCNSCFFLSFTFRK